MQKENYEADAHRKVSQQTDLTAYMTEREKDAALISPVFLILVPNQ